MRRTRASIDYDKEQLASQLRSSLLEFTRTFFPLLTSRDFVVPQPAGRESHVISICRALTRAYRLEIPSKKLIINVPPGHSKSTLLAFWVAWTMSSYPDSRFLYISYAKGLAAKHTETIKRIMSLSHYEYLFDVRVSRDSRAKDHFQTEHGGSVCAFGSGGAIVGQDAGLPALNRFSGALILDDPHKVDSVTSDTMREDVIENYRQTLQQRGRGVNVPYIYIGQRVHEADLADYLKDGKDGSQWEQVILRSLDDCDNPLYPEAFPYDLLKQRQQHDIYMFAAQHQQDPQPAGGALFKPEWFVELDEEPDIFQTFITADTAETSKSYNDATVFSFWGVYEIDNQGVKTGQYGLHWIDCLETRVEPKDLQPEFMQFWTECSRHSMPPKLAAIEKKSTGVTLTSVLEDIRGLQIRDIKRSRADGNKTQRLLETQPYVAAKLISFTAGDQHVTMCKEHMSKITANETHRHDDIADTLADAVRIALIDQTLISAHYDHAQRDLILDELAQDAQRLQQLKRARDG